VRINWLQFVNELKILPFSNELDVQNQVEPLFTGWPKVLPDTELSVPRQVSMNLQREQALVLHCCRDKDTQRELLVGGWLANCYQNQVSPCPQVLLSWCFKLGTTLNLAILTL
jgi:hypothetical protein